MKTKHFGVLAATFFAMSFLPSSTRATTLFEGLGFLPGDTFSVAEGVSADGSTVVGYSNSGDNTVTQGFRWTAPTGMVGIGFLPSSKVSIAYGANVDGSVVVGSSNYTSNQTEAIRWTASTGMVGLGFLSSGNGNLRSSYTTGVSANGSVAVGSSTYLPASTLTEAFRWTASTGMIGLGFLPSTNISWANAVSGNGSVVVGGSQENGTGSSFAYRWTASTGMVNLGTLPGCCGTDAYAISANGSVVVGTSNGEAFLWTATGGMVDLGVQSTSSYFGVDADGSVVVGQGDIDGHLEAFEWTSLTGVQSIQDILEDDGASLTGWTLLSAMGVSADGTIITGYGINPSGQAEAWIADLSATPLPAALPLFATGLGVMGLLGWRTKRRTATAHAAA